MMMGIPIIIVIATMTTTTHTIAAMSQESFRLRRLDISGLDLTLVPPHSLALALTKLEEVTMMIIYMHSHPNPTKVSVAESWLCPDQLKAIFRAMASTAPTPSTSSSSSWSTPRSPTSSSSWSSPSSVSTRTGQKKLTVLNLHGVPLSFLDPSTFASAISQVRKSFGQCTRQNLLLLKKDKIV